MIYLLDDKKKRQSSYGWTEDILNKYKDVLRSISTSNEAIRFKDSIFSEDENVILFHESFFDTSDSIHRKESLQIKIDIEKYALNNLNCNLAVFSGSKNSRKKINNLIHLPVSVLYKNLEIFLEKYRTNDNRMEYLLYGENFLLEERLNVQLEIYKLLFTKVLVENPSSLNEKIERFNELSGKTIQIKEDMPVYTLKSLINV